jgi:hypothetical protein
MYVENTEDHQDSQHQYTVSRLYVAEEDTNYEVPWAKKFKGKTV